MKLRNRNIAVTTSNGSVKVRPVRLTPEGTPACVLRGKFWALIATSASTATVGEQVPEAKVPNKDEWAAYMDAPDATATPAPAKPKPTRKRKSTKAAKAAPAPAAPADNARLDALEAKLDKLLTALAPVLGE